MADDVWDVVVDAFVEAVGVPPPLGPRTTQDDVESWDSLTNVHLVLTIESRLGISLPDGMLVGRVTLGEIMDAVAVAGSAARR